MLLGALSLGASATTAAASGPTTPPFTQCPAVGGDTSCGLLIVINPNGSPTVLSDPGQGPYDAIEDTLIGVQNLSGQTIPSLPISGSDIFGLDGDGLCTQSPRPAGCPFGATGYEGPGTAFTITDADRGTVLFAGGLAPGASAYFSLEGRVASSSLSIDAFIQASGTAFSAVEGATSSRTAATFTDSDTGATASDYAATIDWGDGSSSPGAVGGGGGSFTVSGSHGYAEEGTFTVSVTITDVDNPSNTATARSTATVSDAALSAACAAPATSTASFNGPVVTLGDADPGGTATDFTATIGWGDGSSSAGTITGPSGGPFAVGGTHTFASTGFFTITTTVRDAGGSTASTSCTLLVFAFAPGGGAFVIGDGNSASGASATFWSARWSSLNSVSGGTAPASFKGFAETPATPGCGRAWSTDTGNSTPPPAGPLPAYMAVIVTGFVSQSGPTDSGSTAHIVVVRTAAGYAADPGHDGTGTVAALVC